ALQCTVKVLADPVFSHSAEPEDPQKSWTKSLPGTMASVINTRTVQGGQTPGPWKFARDSRTDPGETLDISAQVDGCNDMTRRSTCLRVVIVGSTKCWLDEVLARRSVGSTKC